MDSELEKKLKKFGIDFEARPYLRDYFLRSAEESLEVLESLKQNLGYKTVDVEVYSYTGGLKGQIEKIIQLSKLGKKVLPIIEYLGGTGYKLNDYWDSRGSIGEGDLEAIKELASKDTFEKYQNVLSKTESIFRRKFNYVSSGALFILSLLKFKEEEQSNILHFLNYCNYKSLDKSRDISEETIKRIAKTDPETARIVLESLKQHFGYKTVDVNQYTYTGGFQGQVKRLLELVQLGKEVPDIIANLASANYKLDDYWDSKGSIGEDDVKVVKNLLKKDALNKYLELLNRVQTVFKKNFNYKAMNTLSIIELLKFSDENSLKFIEILNHCGYYAFFEKNDSQFKAYDLEGIMESDFEVVKNVSEKLKKRFGYKTVDVAVYSYTGGAQEQVRRILEISRIGKKALEMLDFLADTGYKLNTYWDSKGSIGGGDVEVFKFLSKKENMERYLSLLNNFKTVFKESDFKYEAANALFMIDLLKFSEEGYSKIIKFLKLFNYPDVFKKERSKLSSTLLSSIAKSDVDFVEKVSEKLKKRFGYKAIDVEVYSYTGGVDGQVKKILEISSVGEKALEAIDALADTGHRFNTYWDSKGSIGEVDVNIIKKLAETDNMERYRQVVDRLKKLGYKYKPNRDSENKDIGSLIKVSFVPGDVLKAIDLLAEEGYKIKEGITSHDIHSITEAANQIWNKEAESMRIKHKCFYKESTEDFIELFSNMKSVEEKKKIIKALMNCRHTNQDVIKWLDDNEPQLVREVGLLL